jgi:hypothetical protein
MISIRICSLTPLFLRKLEQIIQDLKDIQLRLSNYVGLREINIGNLFSLSYAEAADTPGIDKKDDGIIEKKPTVEKDENPSATISAIVRVAQMALVALILMVTCLIAYMSVRYIFSTEVSSDPTTQQQHQDNKKFAQDLVKTLVGFFAGIATGILVGK